MKKIYSTRIFKLSTMKTVQPYEVPFSAKVEPICVPIGPYRYDPGLRFSHLGDTWIQIHNDMPRRSAGKALRESKKFASEWRCDAKEMKECARIIDKRGYFLC